MLWTMNYYRGTDLYGALSERAGDRFVWASGDAWCLVYGDAGAVPKLAVFVEAVEAERLSASISAERSRVRDAFFRLAYGAGIPSLHLRFAADRTLGRVAVIGENGEAAELSLEELSLRFLEAGVPIREGPAIKAINLQSSSAYHDWQRAALGGEITVSDLDLLRLGQAEAVTELIEVKRSYIELNRWRPYPQDFNNFRLLARLAEANGVPFTISYHRFSGAPRVDDLSELSFWQVESHREPPVVQLGLFELDRFIDGEHLPPQP